MTQLLMQVFPSYHVSLTHSPLVLHICINELGQHCGSDNGLSPIQRQAIIWTNAGLLSIRPLRTINFTEISIKIQNLHSQKCIWKYHLRNGGHFVQGEISLNGFLSPRQPFVDITFFGPLKFLDGLAKDCGNSSANALELPQSCAKSSIWSVNS